MKKYLNFILFTITLSVTAKSIDPLSKIEITSSKAIAQKNKSSFELSYIDNVKVKLADSTTANADKLIVKINYDKNSKNKQENIKKIILEGNVFIKKENIKINSDKAVIYPSKKLCKLSGNIIIEQTKKDNKQFPIITKCNFATIDLVTEKLKLKGSKTAPINTIIKLENHNLTKNRITQNQ